MELTGGGTEGLLLWNWGVCVELRGFWCWTEGCVELRGFRCWTEGFFVLKLAILGAEMVWSLCWTDVLNWEGLCGTEGLLKNRMEMVTNVNFHRNEKPVDDVRISKVSSYLLLVRIKRKSLKNLEWFSKLYKVSLSWSAWRKNLLRKTDTALFQQLWLCLHL